VHTVLRTVGPGDSTVLTGSCELQWKVPSFRGGDLVATGAGSLANHLRSGGQMLLNPNRQDLGCRDILFCCPGIGIRTKFRQVP
jgi:hypothetical protein